MNDEERKEYYRKYQKEYRKKNKEKIKEYELNRRPKDTKHKRNQEYWRKNKSRLTEYHKRYQKERSLVDLEYKMKRALRSSLYKKMINYEKNHKTMDLLGCDFEKFKEYMESKFKDGMAWDNYGEWHIDHIKPCSLFNFLRDNDIKECFHYTNLQPLWAEENLKKHTKY
jgi:hypothetical protein